MARDRITIAQQVAMRRAGFKVSEVASAAGVDTSTMARRLVKMGVQPDDQPIYSRRPRGRKLDGCQEEVRRLHWEEGLSTRQMAERLGVSKYTVVLFMWANEIPVRDRKQAVRERFNSDSPPRRERVSTSFTSETAGEASRSYREKRRKMDEFNRRRRDQRAAARETA